MGSLLEETTTVLDLFSECEQQWGERNDWTPEQHQLTEEILSTSTRSLDRMDEVDDIDKATILTEEEVATFRKKIAELSF